MKSEHYKNHPNDKEPSIKEKYWNSKYEKLRYRYSINDIKKRISIMLLREQIRHDSDIKSTMIAMYPNEYREALRVSMEEFGACKKRKVRRKELIESMHLNNKKISR